MEQSVEEVGDLYLDVAESFMETGEYEKALPLLSCLVCSEQYNLAAVWLRHAGKAFTWLKRVYLFCLPFYDLPMFSQSIFACVSGLALHVPDTNSKESGWFNSN